MANTTIRNIGKVLISNIVTLFSGVLVAFLLPRIISITDYGYYKTFTLYVSYVCLLHFGFCDGIYLKYGGSTFEYLNKTQFRMYFKTFVLLEIFISVVIATLTVTVIPQDLKYIFFCLSVYTLFKILNTYYQLLSQATSRFNEYSLRNIIFSSLQLIGVVILWVYHSNNAEIEIEYKVYLAFIVALEVVLAGWYIYTYRDISFGASNQISQSKKEILGIFKIGFPLLVSNLASTFLLTIDRQFVNVLFSKEVYAKYAFAYNMLALVTTLTSAASTVLFPKIKSMTEDELENNYSFLSSAVLIVVFFCLAVYFPLKQFVIWFLPQYGESIEIVRIIFPGLAVSSLISIVMYNYHKALGITNRYLRICILILVLSAVANYGAYILFHSTVSISIASIIVMLFWYLAVQHYFIIKYNVRWGKTLSYLILMMAGFYLVSSIENDWLGLLLYILVFVLLLLLFHKQQLSEMKRILIKQE